MSNPSTLAVQSPSPRAGIARSKAAGALLAIIFLALSASAIWAGLRLRQWIYPASEQFRFHYDINNAWTQGRGVVDDARQLDPAADRVPVANLMRAFLSRYDTAIQNHPDGDYQLDYPPARLLIMSIWVWRQTDDGKGPLPQASMFGAHFWSSQQQTGPADLAGPLLDINTLFELAAMAGAFMLTRAVLRRGGVKWADFLALGPAILLWFNPALLLDAHVWPQWEAWPLPFWLWAGYFAVTRRWLASGMCLGLGAMFKGQIALTMGVFILWPLFQWRLRALLDVVVGILFGAMLETSPWMLWSLTAKIVFGIVLVATFVLLPRLPRRWRMTALCGIVGCSLLLSGLMLWGDFAWWRVGFIYGADRWTDMNRGPAPNLPQTLSNDYGWQTMDVVYTLDLPRFGVHTDITMQEALGAVYALGLLLASIAAALQDSRNDRRLLLALGAPWLVMFAILPQMHERYLVWGAALTALAVAVSVGTTLLHVLVTITACIPIALSLPGSGDFQRQYPWLGNLLGHANDHLSWVTVLVAIIWIYLSLAGGWRSKAALPQRE